MVSRKRILSTDAAALDFGTKKGTSTASGLFNGCGSNGQIFGATAPGWADKLAGQRNDIWNPRSSGGEWRWRW